MFFLSVCSLSAGELDTAHASYLDGQFKEMASEARDILASTKDPVVEANVCSLLNMAYEANDGKIPVDWKLPDGIDYTLIGLMNRNSKYSLRLSIGTDKTDPQLEQVQLIQFPDKVVLDKENKVGYFEQYKEDEGGAGWYLATDFVSEQPKEGLYLLNIKVSGKPVVNGWVIISNLISTKSPEVIIPQKDQLFSTSTPEFKWKNFYSDGYKKFEKRKISLRVVQDDNDIWELALGGAKKLATKATVDKNLLPGKYTLKLSYKERRYFGPVALERVSRTDTPFSVQ